MPQRIVFIVLIAVAVLAGGALFLLQSMRDGADVRIAAQGGTGLPRIGGPFQLIDQHGRPFSDADLRGRPALIFFGYTQCPDVCPMTMLKITEVLDMLGPQGDPIQPVFITVDPLRDTPEVVADYIANFHSRFIGLTGTRQQIAAVERAYAVYAKAAEGADKNGDYLVDHTAFVYLMGPDGALLTFLQQTATPGEMATKLRDLL